MNSIADARSVEAPLPKIGYSFKEAQKITGLGRTTLWKAIDDGKLKCFRVGRRVLFSLKHLQDYMELNEGAVQMMAKRANRSR